MFGKTFFTEKYGSIDLQSNALHNNYKINRHRTSLTNDIIWNPPSLTTKKGFVNSISFKTSILFQIFLLIMN